MNKERKWYYSKQFGMVCLACYGLLTILSLLWVRNLQVTGRYSESMLPQQHPYMRESSTWYESFPVEDALILSVSTDSDIFTTENLKRVKTMGEELQQNPLIEAVYSLTQLANSEENIFTKQPFLTIDDSQSISHMQISIEEIAILRSLFLSADAKALLIYLIPKADADSNLVGRYLDEFKDYWRQESFTISVSGLLYHEYQNRENVVYDLVRISLLGLFLLGLIYYIFLRSIPVTALLLLNSFIPSLIMFGVLSITETPIDLMTVLLPLFLFSISTAYSIHYCKTYQITKNRLETLTFVGQIIVLSALTTMVGYSNLLFLNSNSMQILGICLLFGILLSVFSILFCIPIILESFSLGRFSSWEHRVHTSHYPTGRNRTILIILYSMILIIVLCGLFWYSNQWYYKEGYHQELRSFVPMEREERAFSVHNGRTQTMDIFIDTNTQYGLVDTEIYSLIDRMTKQIRALDTVTSIISYTDITSYGNGMLYGIHREIPPKNEAEIGETLELISAYREDLPLNFFVDQAYEKTRLLITFDDSSTKDSHEKVLLYREILTIIEATIAKMEGSTYFAAGRPLLLKALNSFFLSFLSKAVPLFFLSIFLFGLIILKSLRKSILLMIPSFFASCLYIGLNAWFKQPISVFNLFGLYTLMGISVDDSFYFLLNLNHIERRTTHLSMYELVSEVYHTTGINIIETTLIVTGGLFAALISGTLPIVRTILLVIMSLHFSTFTTLFIMPQFLVRAQLRPHQKSKTEESL